MIRESPIENVEGSSRGLF